VLSCKALQESCSVPSSYLVNLEMAVLGMASRMALQVDKQPCQPLLVPPVRRGAAAHNI
jgi:hypothetical protein